MPVGAAQSSQPVEVVARGSFGGQVTDGALFYPVFTNGRTGINRLELSTGERRRVYTAPRGVDVFGLEADGGRVGFQTDDRAHRHRIYLMDAASRAALQLAHGRIYERRDCGHDLKLHDVSPAGELLYEETIVPCDGKRGTLAVRAYDPATGTRTLRSRRMKFAPISQGEPSRRLAGDQLLTAGESRARVRDLSSGAARQIRSLGARSSMQALDVAGDGRVIVHDWRGVRDRPEETIRLMRAADSGRGGAVVHRTRRAFGEARFCGSRAVLFTITKRARYRLSLLDPAAPLAEGVLPDADTETTCDAHQFVVTTVAPRRADRAYVFTLPPS